MAYLIDRRPNDRGKSAVNRERFLRRYKTHIQDAVKKPPPPKEFIEATRKQLDERFPDAKQVLDAARKWHLELKEARKAGRIEEVLGLSLVETNAAPAAPVVEAAILEGDMATPRPEVTA